MKIKVADLEFEPLLSKEMIGRRVKAIGGQLCSDYRHTTPVFIGVLNGSFLFFSDLMKQIDIPCQVAFTKLSSYHGGTQSTNHISDDLPLAADIRGRDVVVIEDIVDTGNTAHHLLEKLWYQQPASVALCSLLLKPGALVKEIGELKYVGFEIENEFVVGYGLDYKELGRNLQDIYKRIT